MWMYEVFDLGMDIFNGKPIQVCCDWNQKLFLIEACSSDEQLLLSWRNEEKTRQQSVTSHIISSEEHHNWFHGVLEDPNIKILILYLGGHPIGSIRFECCGGQAMISYSVDCGYRGLGLGTKLICMAINYAEKKLNVSQLFAETKENNYMSQKVLLVNDFHPIGISSEQGIITFGRVLTPPPRGVSDVGKTVICIYAFQCSPFRLVERRGVK